MEGLYKQKRSIFKSYVNVLNIFKELFQFSYMKEKRNKKGLSHVISMIIIVVLVFVAIGIFAGIVFSIISNSVEKVSIKTELMKETFKMNKVVIDPSNLSEIKITFCCAAKDVTTKKIETYTEETNLDIGLVIDRSGSMRQSGWTLNLNPGLSPLQEYENVNVPRDAYSSSNSFTIVPGTERLAISLDWSRITGVTGSEGSEFALNLRRPTGEWIFGNNKPNVGGFVDPPDNVAGPNEYFSGISTKPQVVYIENPASGNWEVKVYGWNLRPKTSPPPSQEVNISVFSGTSSQIIKNPTIISIDAAKDSAKNFVNGFQGETQLSYTVFGSYGELRQTLTSNKNDLLTAIDNTGMEGGTAINRGIEESKDDLINNGRSGIEKIMIILTDGQNDAGPNVVIQEAQDAKNQGIKIFTVGLTGFVDSDMLTTVASQPEYYFYAPDASALQPIFELIRQRIKNEFSSNRLSDSFIIVFYNDTDSYSTELNQMDIGVLETRTFSFDLNGKITNIKRIEIYPGKETEGGKMIIGDLLQAYEL